MFKKYWPSIQLEIEKREIKKKKKGTEMYTLAKMFYTLFYLVHIFISHTDNTFVYECIGAVQPAALTAGHFLQSPRSFYRRLYGWYGPGPDESSVHYE